MAISHTPLSPLERYRQALETRGFEHDPAQARVVEALDRLYHDLVAVQPNGAWQRLLTRFNKRTSPIRGLYIWGAVGRGKTWLMDCFYRSLPFTDKRRLHFHHFMRAVHDELKTLREHEDPLAKVAARWADSTRVICFDEFAVADIADATILGRLLSHLFARGVTLVATSNIAPDDLYKGGLKRELFLPAIGQIKKHTRTIHCDNGDDYRLRQLSQARLYYTPLGRKTDQALDERFEAIAGTVEKSDEPLLIEGREITPRRVADGVAWFGFDALCTGPRSADDYIEIARLFHTVILSDVPRLDADREAETRRFIALVDEFYDRSVKLIVSAAAKTNDLYDGQRLRMEFERTRSRLIEMQSKEYLSRPHAA
jgi:cell division protein ZapE